MDAITEANKFGIRPEYSTNFLSDEEGTALNYGTVCMAISSVRNNVQLTSDWKKDIEADYSKRNVKGDGNV